MNYYWSLFLLACLVPYHAFGQETDSLHVNLKPIEVKATHSSVTVSEAPLSLSVQTRDGVERIASPAITLDRLTYFRGFIVLFTEVCLNLLLCFVRRG